MIHETNGRSVAKAVSWRLLATLTTLGIVFLVTRRADVAIGVGLADMMLKLFLRFTHERLWNRLPRHRKTREPFVIWFTGLSGSGKSTIASRVHQALGARGLRAEYMDGDEVRRLFPDVGFTRKERDRHIRSVGHLASVLEKNGVIVVASFISPYAASRDFVRSLCRRFIEIHVSTPLEVCEQRDPKGLYAMARRGEKSDVTGIHDPYEPPERCELSVNTAECSEDAAFAKVMAHLDLNYLSR